MSASIVLALRILATIALYVFLAWALYTLYSQVNRQGFQLANRRIPGISLMIRSESGNATLRHFAQPKIILGRDPSSDIPLSDERVSARHAQLVYHHGQWWLEDLASTNGTFLNSTPISMPTVITSGDEIMCGAIRLTVSLSENIIIEPTQRVKKTT